KSLEMSYGSAARFSECVALIASMLETAAESVADFNIDCVIRLAGVLGLERKFVRQSDLRVSGRSTALLASIARAVGADCYLSGDGAAKYQDDALLIASGLRVERLNYRAPSYSGDGFIAGLSVIDFMMKCNPETFSDLHARSYAY